MLFGGTSEKVVLTDGISIGILVSSSQVGNFTSNSCPVTCQKYVVCTYLGNDLEKVVLYDDMPGIFHFTPDGPHHVYSSSLPAATLFPVTQLTYTNSFHSQFSTEYFHRLTAQVYHSSAPRPPPKKKSHCIDYTIQKFCNFNTPVTPVTHTKVTKALILLPK